MKLPKRLEAIKDKCVLPAGRKLFVFIPYYWGSGTTLEEALDNLKAAGGKKLASVAMIIWDAPEGTTVTGMGGLSYPTKDEDGNEIERPKQIHEFK